MKLSELMREECKGRNPDPMLDPVWIEYAEALEAEVAKYREALEDIADQSAHPHPKCPSAWSKGNRARQALGTACVQPSPIHLTVDTVASALIPPGTAFLASIRPNPITGIPEVVDAVKITGFQEPAP